MILAGEGIDARPLAWHPLALRLSDPTVAVGWRWWYVAGLAHYQEKVSLLPAFLLQPLAVGERPPSPPAGADIPNFTKR